MTGKADIAPTTSVADRTRAARPVAILLVVLTALLAAIGLIFLSLSASAEVVRFGVRGFPIMFAAAGGGLGYLITSRRPENPIGWLFLTLGLISGLQTAAEEYAVYALLTPSGAPAGLAIAWLQAWIWVPLVGISSSPLLLLLPHRRVAFTCVATGLLAVHHRDSRRHCWSRPLHGKPSGVH